MSCLTLTVTDKSQQDLRIGTTPATPPLSVTTERAHAPLALRLRLHCPCRPSRLLLYHSNTPLSITAALVCRIGNNKWDYFEVAEGPLVVEEGYLKVYHD